jgi:membrane protease YdiL (CAAX protease family)
VRTLTPFGWYHLVFFGVLVPVGAIRSKARISGRPLPPRRAHFFGTMVMLWLFAAASMAVARAEGIRLFPAQAPRAEGVIAGVVMLIVTMAFMRPRWRRAVEQRTRIVYLFMPRDATERLLWLLVAASAGFSEEITWRAVQPVLLTRLIGQPVLAAALVAVTFGIGHMVQGWRSAAIIVAFAVSFQVVVWLSGSLYVAMAVHFLYDLAAGLTYGKLGEELGYPVEGVTQPGEPAPA